MRSSRTRRRPRTALVSGLALAGLVVAAPSALATPPTGQPVDITVEKAADGTTYAPGGVITYTIIVSNVGNTPVPVDRIKIVDPLVTNLVPQRPLTVMQPGGSLRYVGTHTATAAECGLLTNTVTVSIIPPTGNQPPLEEVGVALTNNGNSVTVTIAGCTPPTPPAPPTPPPPVIGGVVTPPKVPVKPPPPPICPLPKLGASISGNGFVVAGRPVKYTVRVTNGGKNVATRTKATISLPPGYSLVNRPKGITPKGRTLGVTIGTLGAGGERTVMVSLRPDTATSGARVVKVDVTARCGKTATATARTLVAAAGARRQPAVTG